MKAAVRRKYGSPDVIQIEDIKRPTPKEDEVLVKVRATTVNRTDCANLTAKPFIMRFVLGLLRPTKIILGTDYAGEVVEVGGNVKNVKLNDRVFGFNDSGLESHAEFITVSEEHIWHIPESISFKEAAASLEGAHYAYTFVKKSEFKPKQKVLINGATGAIGSALLQFVKEHDVEITATCKPEMNDTILSLGADKTIDYTKADFTESKEKYDFVFDAVGKTTFGKSKRVLTKTGVYISSELGPNGQNIYFSLSTSKSKGNRVVFPIPFQTQETIPFILDLLKSEKLKPLIDKMYSIENIDEAYSYAMSGNKNGSLIVEFPFR
jgi:NADPH:quinone reductase-like Zn-dependent oxidoreductase